MPEWLDVHKKHAPDFVVQDPKHSPVSRTLLITELREALDSSCAGVGDYRE